MVEREQFRSKAARLERALRGEGQVDDSTAPLLATVAKLQELVAQRPAQPPSRTAEARARMLAEVHRQASAGGATRTRRMRGATLGAAAIAGAGLLVASAAGDTDPVTIVQSAAARFQVATASRAPVERQEPPAVERAATGPDANSGIDGRLNAGDPPERPASGADQAADVRPPVDAETDERDATVAEIDVRPGDGPRVELSPRPDATTSADVVVGTDAPSTRADANIAVTAPAANVLGGPADTRGDTKPGLSPGLVSETDVSNGIAVVAGVDATPGEERTATLTESNAGFDRPTPPAPSPTPRPTSTPAPAPTPKGPESDNDGDQAGTVSNIAPPATSDGAGNER